MRMIMSAAVAVVLVSSVVVLAAGTEVGTWKLNVAKSKYSPGPAPKSNTAKIEAWGDDGYKLTSNGTDAEGKPTHIEYAVKFDGKDVAIKGSPNSDTISAKRIDASTIETTSKKAGKVVMTIRSTVAKDGKTRTSVYTGKNAQGADVRNTAVYEKQ
jgi:hypothetical protein